MKRITLAIAGVALVLLPGGCSYRGAVYSEYSQLALDIRASQVSGAPVKVNFGYDRAVMAYIPKRSAESNSIQGEAVSVISWNNVGSDINPMHPTNTLLRVDAGFITGVAANVASAPSNATVIIVDPRLSTNQVLTTEGSPGARIAAAFAPATLQVRPDVLQRRVEALAAKMDRLSETDAEKVMTSLGIERLPGFTAKKTLRSQISGVSTPDAAEKWERALSSYP